MANYTFSVDGAETGTVGQNQTAFVYNLDFFDKTDAVTAAFDSNGLPSGTLAFEIGGGINLNLTGYAGITGFSTVMARSATGGVRLTIGQDFYDAGSARAVVAQSDANGAVWLDASSLTGTRGVHLEARADSTYSGSYPAASK
ncbi:MAG: hypothetical protein ACRC67_42135 [Inquilinus sp.]|uniref:hypothetical protein n=1 Tax=Inquilinus sp. TaxID=1932117 RepID=UPI003F311746